MYPANRQTIARNDGIHQKNTRQYWLVVDRTHTRGSNHFAGNRNRCFIPVYSRREIELFLLSLGKTAGILINEAKGGTTGTTDPWNWLSSRSLSEITHKLQWSYREEAEVLEIVERIPLPDTLHYSFLKTHPNNPDPERISPEFVHKHNPNNVLISVPYRCGNMIYFNSFAQSAEFEIDHQSDHLEGIVTFEIARQSAIASAHLEGMPFSGTIVILKTATRYQKFIDMDQPILVRTIPAYKPKGGVGFCVYQILQNGQSCVTGYFSAIVYKTKQSYQKFRNLKLSSNHAEERVIEL